MARVRGQRTLIHYVYCIYGWTSAILCIPTSVSLCILYLWFDVCYVMHGAPAFERHLHIILFICGYMSVMLCILCIYGWTSVIIYIYIYIYIYIVYLWLKASSLTTSGQFLADSTASSVNRSWVSKCQISLFWISFEFLWCWSQTKKCFQTSRVFNIIRRHFCFAPYSQRWSTTPAEHNSHFWHIINGHLLFVGVIVKTFSIAHVITCYNCGSHYTVE